MKYYDLESAFCFVREIAATDPSISISPQDDWAKNRDTVLTNQIFFCHMRHQNVSKIGFVVRNNKG